MSKPSLASKIADAFKRLFNRSTRPVVSSKSGDMAAGGAETKESGTQEPVPAETADSDAAAEFATEVASAEEQEPTEPPQPAKPLESTKAAESAEAPQAAPESAKSAEAQEAEQPAAQLPPEERAELAETLKTAEAETVSAPTSAFSEAVDATEQSDAATAEPPLPNYDSLTLPSVRARLRKLTIDQVRQLRAYEAAHANRPEFVRMYDNRVAKLEAQAAEGQ